MRRARTLKYRSRVGRIRSLSRDSVFDLLIALLLIAAMLEVLVGRNSPDAPRSTLWFVLPAIAILVLPIVARRRFPLAPAAHWLLAIGIAFVDWRLIPFAISIFVVGLVAAFLLGSIRDSLQAAVGLAVVVAGSVAVVYKIPGHTAAMLVFIPLEFAISWVAGFALRERAERAEAAEVRAAEAELGRDAAARIAVAEERVRIARELHDVVAHAVSVMVLQVGAVRHKLPDARSEDRDALRSVEHAGRTALAEMRGLLAAMRRDGDEAEFAPQPGLDGLDSLLEEIGRAGLPVQLHVDGDPVALPRGIDLSAYRIVQEGLTNALKHARASKAEVTVCYRPDELRIDVCDNGEGGSTTNGLGHGLVGVHERVKIYGGEMSAGAANGSGFILSTRFPIRGERR
jgi:signal transduction histidine kinase